MRRLLSLALLLPLAACSERRSDPVAPGSAGEISASHHQTGFPLVIVRQGPGTAQSTQAGAPVVDNIADALERVATDGTIRVHPGTYPTSVGIHRPVTIVGNGIGPTLVPADPSAEFTAGLTVVADGNTTIRNLRFEGYTEAIQIGESPGTDPYDLVAIDGVHIQVPDGFNSGVTAFGPAHEADGRRIEVRNSTIIGGWRGLHVQEDVPDFHAIGNTFSGQTFELASAIGFSSGASGRIEGNSLTRCDECVNVGGGDRTRGVVEIVGNHVTIDFDDHPTNDVIVAAGAFVEIAGNLVEGVGGTREPNDQATWPIRSHAIHVGSAGQAEIRGNTVTGAFFAYGVGPSVGTVQGLDNVADGVQTGFLSFFTEGKVTFQSSDFTNYQVPLHIDDITGFDLTCNWWGSTDGPQGAVAPDPSVYTPWATAPVAGTSTTSCSGGQ